jgi:hypothetical protein
MAVKTTIEQAERLYFITFYDYGFTANYFRAAVRLHSRVLHLHGLGVETRQGTNFPRMHVKVLY